MPSATAAPSNRPCHPQSLDGPSVDAVYRRGFSAIAMAPAVLVALPLAFAAFEHFRGGSIPPAESVILLVIAPFLVVPSLLWAIVVWYGTCVCIGETAISLHEMSPLFGPQTRSIPWNEIEDVSLSGVGGSFWGRAVVVTLREGGPLIIWGIPEPECLRRAVKRKLPL